MHLPFYPLHSGRKQRPFAALVATVLAPLLASCASPGPPRPPSLHLPEVVTDLSAQRTGNEVHLRWTTPSRTTDKLNAPSPMMAEVCRETNPKPETAKPANAGRRPPAPQTIPGCEVVLHLTVKPGPSEAAARLPAALTVDPVTPLGYRVRMLNPTGSSAGFSHSVLVPSGEAPPLVAGLRATASRNGAVLEWKPLASASLVELDRTLVDAPSAKTPPKKSAVTVPDEQPAEVKLRTGPEEKDAGGTLDRTVLGGQSYIYRAQRIRKVEIAGQRYELRSDESAPVTLAMTDRFPPAAPTGLAAIPGSQSGTATLDLSWQPNVEPDIAGYNVYRRQGSSGNFERVTDRPALGPAFSDAAAVPGTAYTYRVTAVDKVGNESPPSGEVTETTTRP